MSLEEEEGMRAEEEEGMVLEGGMRGIVFYLLWLILLTVLDRPEYRDSYGERQRDYQDGRRRQDGW